MDAFLGIVFVSFALRSAVTSVSPVASVIGTDIPFSEPGLGLIGTLPLVAFAASGVLVPFVARSGRLESLVLVAAAVMTAGEIFRALAWNYWTFLVGSSIAFIGIGVGNVLVAPLIRRHFPHRVGVLTAVYAAALAVSMVVPAGLATEVTSLLGWRTGLVVWAVPAVLCMPFWMRVARRRADGRDHTLVSAHFPARYGFSVWRSRTAWLIACAMALTSLNAFVAFAWLPQLLAERAGMDAFTAGWLLALFALLGLPLAIIMPIVVERFGGAGYWIQLGSVLFVASYALLLLAPDVAAVLAVALGGLGPLIFPLCLVLVNLCSRTERGAVTLSGFIQGIGYALAAVWPLIIGILRTVTQSWTVPIIVLCTVTASGLVIGVLLRHPAFVEDDGRVPPIIPQPQN